MKILIADDHRIVLEAVHTRLKLFIPDAQFVLVSRVGQLKASAADDLDLMILDMVMPGLPEGSHIDLMLRMHPKVPILVLTGFGDSAVMRSLFERGVRGFVPKTNSTDLMISAVGVVLSGGIYVPPEILDNETLITDLKDRIDAQEERAPIKTVQRLRAILTKRQFDVLELLAHGNPNKTIGKELEISEGTVKVHMAAIFSALEVKNRTEAVVAAQAILWAQ